MMDNVWNVSKAPPLSDPIKFIFQQTNQRIINLLREELDISKFHFFPLRLFFFHRS